MSVVRTFLKLLLGRGVYTSYAQFGEDLIIRPYTQRKKGAYVDVGCYHPILYSNTYRLYRQGWQGVVIDPNKSLKTLFAVFRPRDTFIHAAVGEQGKGTYVTFEDGAYNTFDTELAKTYEKRSRRIGTYSVSLHPLSELLDGIERIDVLSIDVEGYDLEVLKTHNWSVVPGLVIIETRPDSEAGVFLYSKGYELIGMTKLNSLFRHPSAV